jgi:hypothetical protein
MAQFFSSRQLHNRWAAWCASAFVAATLLSACGGGIDVQGDYFSFGIFVDGRSQGGVQIYPGEQQDIYIRAGQSIELDADEPVVWTLYVGNSAISGSGVTVGYGGAYITQTAVSRSRIVVSTSSPYLLAATVPITLVATSTIDAAQVATFRVLITN